MRKFIFPASRRSRRWLRAVTLGSVFWATTSPARAESLAASTSAVERGRAKPVQVTWPAIVRAMDEHPRIRAGKLEVDAARGAAAQAGTVPNPTLEATVGQGRARTTSDSRLEWSLAMNLPLGWIAEHGSKVARARAEVDVAVAESHLLRREALLELGTLFWKLAYEQARVATLEALAAQSSGLVAIVRRRVEQGEVRPVDALRVEIELEKIQGELEVARTARAARQTELGWWLGMPQSGALEAVADWRVLPRPMALETALAKVRKSHPVREAARARTRALVAEVDRQKRARLPGPVLTAFTEQELDRRSYGLGLMLDLPVFNRNAGGIAQAEAKLAQGRKQAEAQALELETTLVEAQAACQASVVNATRLRDQVLPRSEASAAIMQRTYELGEASLLELIDARRTLLESQRLSLGALIEAQRDCHRLGILVGEELP